MEDTMSQLLKEICAMYSTQTGKPNVGNEAQFREKMNEMWVMTTGNQVDESGVGSVPADGGGAPFDQQLEEFEASFPGDEEGEG